MRISQSKLECLSPAFSHWALRSPYYNQRSKTKFNSYSCTSKQNQTPHDLKFWITNWQKLLVKAIKHFNFLRMLWKKNIIVFIHGKHLQPFKLLVFFTIYQWLELFFIAGAHQNSASGPTHFWKVDSRIGKDLQPKSLRIFLWQRWFGKIS